MPRARKAGTRSTAASAPRASRPEGDPRSRLIDAALDLAAAKGWRTIGMGEIARAADVPLGEAYSQFPAKPCLLAGFTRRVNETVLAAGDPNGSTQEQLFELLMRRFDALKPHRAALRAIMRDSVGDPAAVLGVPATLNAMAWMLEGAGVSAAGWRGKARLLALTGAYAAVFRTFLTDDSEDLAKTMAALDRRLKSRPFGGSEQAQEAA